MSTFDVSLQDQIAEVRREIEQRKRVYVRMIDQEKMTKAEAERRTVTMCAVLMTLERLRGVPGADGLDDNSNKGDGDARPDQGATADRNGI